MRRCSLVWRPIFLGRKSICSLSRRIHYCRIWKNSWSKFCFFFLDFSFLFWYCLFLAVFLRNSWWGISSDFYSFFFFRRKYRNFWIFFKHQNIQKKLFFIEFRVPQTLSNVLPGKKKRIFSRKKSPSYFLRVKKKTRFFWRFSLLLIIFVELTIILVPMYYNQFREKICRT